MNELDEIRNFDAILISPGPGIPQEAGKIIEVIRMYYDTKNIFGVCLGQQAIAEAFGGRLRNLEKVYHGVSSKITTTDLSKYSIAHWTLPIKITIDDVIVPYHDY